MSVETYQTIRRGAEVYSSENTLSLVRPVLYPQHRYGSSLSKDGALNSIPVLPNLLQALHVATDGAFYEVPIGSQAVPVVPNIRSIETYAAPKKGGIFDSQKVGDAHQSITNHEQPNTPIGLEPRFDGDSPIELERKSGGYLVWLVFRESDEHSESVKKIAKHIGNYVVDVCRRKLHDDDSWAFEVASELSPPRMLVGIIEKSQMPDELQEVAIEDPWSFYETANNRYASMHENGLLDSYAPPSLLPLESKVWFGALSLVYSSRKPKRG